MPPRQEPLAFEKTITKRVGCSYLLYLPQGYGEEAERWPLLLFLHGAGERGDDLELVKKHGPPKLLEEGRDLPFIVVSPQCPQGETWSNDVLLSLLDEIADHYSVDDDRVYLTGLSMGGYGTWLLAAEHPERLAAIAPICGGGSRLQAHKLEHLPVWAFHGAQDQTVPISESEEMVEALRACGGNVRFTVYPDAAHDAWTETYENPALYEWFLQHRRP